jgi:hypothetical protein
MKLKSRNVSWYCQAFLTSSIVEYVNAFVTFRLFVAEPTQLARAYYCTYRAMYDENVSQWMQIYCRWGWIYRLTILIRHGKAVSPGHFTCHVVYPLTNQPTTPCIYPASATAEHMDTYNNLHHLHYHPPPAYKSSVSLILDLRRCSPLPSCIRWGNQRGSTLSNFRMVCRVVTKKWWSYFMTVGYMCIYAYTCLPPMPVRR